MRCSIRPQCGTANAMSKQAAINSSNSQPAAAACASVSLAVLENLAARLNPNGLFLCMVRAGGGAVAYHDASAKSFFQRYVLPLVQSNQSVVKAIQSLTPTSEPLLVRDVPGVMIGALPLVDRR